MARVGFSIVEKDRNGRAAAGHNEIRGPLNKHKENDD